MMQRVIYAGNKDIKDIKMRRISFLVVDSQKTRHRVRISIIDPQIYFLSLVIYLVSKPNHHAIQKDPCKDSIAQTRQGH